MGISKFFKRLVQPSSLGGLAAIALAVPEILGKGGEIGGAVADGITTTGGAIGSGVPWYVAIALGAAAVARTDRSDDK